MTDRPPTTSGFAQFAAEMRRRHVVRFAFGYAAAAFVVLQLAEIVFPAFGIGEAGLRLLVVVTAVGFLPAIVLAWLYDVTTEGIKRTEDGAIANPILTRLALGSLLVATVAITGAVGAYLAGQGDFTGAAPDARDGAGVALTPVEYDPTVPIRSLAVLPLDDFSPEGDQAYFTAGMHEELIAKLSLLEGIRVVSRTTVMQYAGTTRTSPQIGRELNVDALIEGSVSRSGGRTRVTLQIIHAPSDSHIETLQWDRDDVTDVLSFQTEVAHAVVHEIESSHDERLFERTAANIKPAAQDAYFKGKYEYERGTADGYRMALDYFEDAVAEDPTFAPALAGLAGARFIVGLEDPQTSEADLTRAQAEAVKALSLDSASMEAREVLAFIDRSMPRIMADISTVESAPVAPKSIRVVTMPSLGDSMTVDMVAFDTAWVSAVTTLGERIEEQVRRRTTSREAEIDGRGSAMEVRSLMTSGRYQRASEILERVVAESPGSAPAWDMLTRSRVAGGDPSAAVDAVERWSETGSPGSPSRGEAQALKGAVASRGAAGYWAWQLARLEAREAAGQPFPRTDLATAHAALGHADQAFAYLFQALEHGEPAILGLRSDPVWDDLRDDPRFREVAQQAQSLRFSPTRRSGRGEGSGPGGR